MNDKKVKQAMKMYVERQADKIVSEPVENHPSPALDARVYATLSANESQRKTLRAWSMRKISALAAVLVLIVGLGVTAVVLNREPAHVVEDVTYSVVISYGGERYGYDPNLPSDKYDPDDLQRLSQSPELFTAVLDAADIIQAGGGFDRDSLVGARIYPYSDDVLILEYGGQFYCFEKVAGQP